MTEHHRFAAPDEPCYHWLLNPLAERLVGSAEQTNWTRHVWSTDKSAYCRDKKRSGPYVAPDVVHRKCKHHPSVTLSAHTLTSKADQGSQPNYQRFRECRMVLNNSTGHNDQNSESEKNHSYE